MTPQVDELAEHIIQLARERIDCAAYEAAHHRVVQNTLVSWCEERALQPYIPRLLHYCLESRNEVRPIVFLTFQYITGQFSLQEFIKRLRLESAVLDQLNSVPWPYGIRTLRGSDNQWLAPIVRSGVPIDPGQKISRTFKTTCDSQAYVRIELFAGPTTGLRTEGCLPLLARRVRLPQDLPRGMEIEFGIKRVSEAGLRLEIRIPQLAGLAEPWWWIEDSAGFSEVATDVARKLQELLDNEEKLSVRLLLQGCLQFLKNSGALLSEEHRHHLLVWVQETSSALVRRDEDGLKNAVRLLLDDLDRARNESVAVVLETLLVATDAPPEVATEFERLAILLLNRSEDSDAALTEAWTAVENWKKAWRKSGELWIDEKGSEMAEILFGIMESVRRVLLLLSARPAAQFSIKLRAHLHSLFTEIKKALALRELLSLEQLGAFEELNAWLEVNLVKFEPTHWRGAIDRETISIELNRLLAAAFVATGRQFFHITGAPTLYQRKFSALEGLIFYPQEPSFRLKLVRIQMIEIVSDWYQLWKHESPRSGEPIKVGQAEMLVDLLDALESPQGREVSVQSIMEKAPFESGFLHSFGAAFRKSRWTRDVQREALEVVDYHLRVIDQLAAQLQREDLYYARSFWSLAEGAGINDLSAEAQEPLGNWRALVSEEVHRVVLPPSGVWEAVSEPPVRHPDADELLEAVADENGT